jgi:ribosomal protein S27E
MIIINECPSCHQRSEAKYIDCEITEYSKINIQVSCLNCGQTVWNNETLVEISE